jgi:alpha-L-fucosidase
MSDDKLGATPTHLAERANPDEIGRSLARVRPSDRQLRWQSLEFSAFVHFGMNTMTGREWGTGDEDPALFAPDRLDADQWMRGFVDAGMSGVILTAKHHDGFCLWPTRTTPHSVASAPWREGRGDVVREVADAAHRHGLALGIYLSPWDRNHPTYGQGVPYDDVFVAQLTELLTGYGPVFSVWFDGANGEGPHGRVQDYDWDRYHRVIRQLQPDAVISVCGPDVRWCGNEAGHTRAQEWSVVRRELQDVERIADSSQQVDDGNFSRLVRSDDQDLGSREVLAPHLDSLVWYPAEVNTSIRPGWFHHPAEDDQVREADELFEIWCSAVGGNASFLLNVPPSRDGLLASPDLRALGDLGSRLRSLAGRTRIGAARLSSGAVVDSDGAPRVAAVLQRQTDASSRAPVRWVPAAEDRTPSVRIAFDRPTSVSAVMLREDIAQGQRVEEVVLSGTSDGREVELARVGCVGHRRLVRFDARTVTAVTARVTASRDSPRLTAVAVLAAE